MTLFFRILWHSLYFLWFFRKQHAFSKRLYQKEILPICKQFGQDLSPKLYRKITMYYGVSIPYLLLYYTKILGLKFTTQDRLIGTYMGFYIPLFDDITDLEFLDEEEIQFLLNRRELDGNSPLVVKLWHHLYFKLLELVPDKQRFTRKHQIALNAQLESVVQITHEGPGFEDLLQISLSKGGASFVLFYYLLDNVPDEKLEKILFRLGGLHQLANDHFDVYKDLVEEGIYTASNTCKDFKAFFAWYQKQTMDLIQDTRQSSIRQKESFLFFAVGVIARGMVALNQLCELEDKYGKSLDLGSLERKELITDMEKPKNILRTFSYLHQLLKK